MRRALVLLLVLLSLSAQAERRRAVRAPSDDCSFVVLPSFDTIPAEGVSRARVVVGPNKAECTTWNAYSEMDWITIEASPGTAEAFVTVAPNPLTTTRSASVRIAGIDLAIHQDAASVVISPPTSNNLLKNATFNVDASNWGWDPRFPNGAGVASWSSEDANGSIASGSFVMRSTSTRSGEPSFQQMQCVPLGTGKEYVFDIAFRVASLTDGSAGFALVDYESADCSGDFNRVQSRTLRAAAPLTWERRTFRLERKSKTILSVQVILASDAGAKAPFDAWFDDLSLTLE